MIIYFVFHANAVFSHEGPACHRHIPAGGIGHLQPGAGQEADQEACGADGQAGVI